jgi:hypothetical protein
VDNRRAINGRQPWIGTRLQATVTGISDDFCAHLSPDGPAMLPYFNYGRDGS